MDVFPTVLNACGVNGVSVAHQGLDLLAEGDEAGRAGVLSEYYFPSQVLSVFRRDELLQSVIRLAPYLHRLRAWQEGDHRVIWSSAGHHECYDLATDPEEENNLCPKGAVPEGYVADFDRLEDAIDGYAEGRDPGPVPTLESVLSDVLSSADDETVDALRGLGYLK